jgi:hypothetical protein
MVNPEYHYCYVILTGPYSLLEYSISPPLFCYQSMIVYSNGSNKLISMRIRRHEGFSEAEVNILPHFETGQAIFAGVGIRQPLIVKGKVI